MGKIKVVEINRRELGNGVGYVSREIDSVLEEIKTAWDGDDVGSFYTITIKEIEKEKYESLPEFEGF